MIVCRDRPRLNGRMPELTRKRSHPGHDSWGIWYDGVRVGTIGLRSGNPDSTDPWGWDCGFYPGSHPGEQRSSTAATFEAARRAFEAAWRAYLPLRTAADFQAWRDHAAWTAEKYRRFDRGEPMPPDWTPQSPHAGG
jgi:hypothetical protein